MFALVESGNITPMPKGNKGITLNNIQYPPTIYTLWSESERNAIGIYTVEISTTNLKNEDYYINTNITYAFGSGKVTGTYGTATAKAIADSDATDKDGNKIKDDDGNQVINKGLKTIKKNLIDNQCAGLLASSDWMVIKATETGGTMDSGWKTWRASDVDALAALFTYTKQGDGSITRPLGKFPIKE